MHVKSILASTKSIGGEMFVSPQHFETKKIAPVGLMWFGSVARIIPFLAIILMSILPLRQSSNAKPIQQVLVRKRTRQSLHNNCILYTSKKSTGNLNL